MFDETEVLERLVKKMKQFNKITTLLATTLKTSTVITEKVSIAAFASFAGLHVGIALRGTSLFFSVATAITRKRIKIFIIKQEEDDVIKLLAQSKIA